MLTNATRMVGRRLYPEMLPALDSIQIAQESKNSLVIIATNLADHLEYASDGLGDGRALILVQGSESQTTEATSEFQTRSAAREMTASRPINPS
jgi:hypothetical protein